MFARMFRVPLVECVMVNIGEVEGSHAICFGSLLACLCHYSHTDNAVINFTHTQVPGSLNMQRAPYPIY